MKLKKLLEELKELNLPSNKYVIFGSGPLAVRKIRESNDLDILIKEDLFNNLLEKYPQNINNNPTKCLIIGNIDIGDKWQGSSKKVTEIINDSEIIDGLPFANIKHVIEFKKELRRDKDIKDLELIKKYLSK